MGIFNLAASPKRTFSQEGLFPREGSFFFKNACFSSRRLVFLQEDLPVFTKTG
jgi:hypothetical protein